jgi:hypothetical protein
VRGCAGGRAVAELRDEVEGYVQEVEDGIELGGLTGRGAQVELVGGGLDAGVAGGEAAQDGAGRSREGRFEAFLKFLEGGADFGCGGCGVVPVELVDLHHHF